MNAVRNYAASRQGKPVVEEPVTSVLPDGEVPVYDRQLNADEEVLAALGYKPEFKREFSLWTTFCVSFAVLGLLPSFASTLYYVSLLIRTMELEYGIDLGREWDMLGHLEWSGDGSLR